MINWLTLKNSVIILLLLAFPAAAQEENSTLLDQEILMEAALEKERLSSPYDYKLTELMVPLIQIKLDLGKKDQAINLYERIISNIRINQGLNSIDQIPYINQIIDLYFVGEEFEEADNWLDLATHIYRNIYRRGDNQIKILSAYENIIIMRFGANPLDHTCFHLNNEVTGYEHYSIECKGIRITRIEHFIKALILQEEVVELLLGNQDQETESLIENLEYLISFAEFTRNVTFYLELDTDLNIVDAMNQGINNPRELRATKYNPTHYNLIISNAKRELRRIEN